ncbi:hypothetical protein K439DRAFT_1612846 [Ramaria rubella]|nr:hypothetical protein K439DRAFT_1612846 [Ramaria rubella]
MVIATHSSWRPDAEPPPSQQARKPPSHTGKNKKKTLKKSEKPLHHLIQPRHPTLEHLSALAELLAVMSCNKIPQLTDLLNRPRTSGTSEKHKASTTPEVLASQASESAKIKECWRLEDHLRAMNADSAPPPPPPRSSRLPPSSSVPMSPMPPMPYLPPTPPLPPVQPSSSHELAPVLPHPPSSSAPDPLACLPLSLLQEPSSSSHMSSSFG